jgi:type II secretory pathway pseudopilin PulG
MIRSEHGITLLEMVVVVAIAALLVGVTFPAVTAGVDTLRLNAAADSIVSFLNAALNRADRRQQVVEVTISRQENSITMRTADAGFTRALELPEGVKIQAVYPELPGEFDTARHVMLYPGGTPPRIGVEIVNRKNDRRIVRVDPTTGVPLIERPAAAQETR